METQQLTFYSLKLTKKEYEGLLNGQPNPTNLLICFVMDKKGGFGFKAAMFVQNADSTVSSKSVLLQRLDNSSYVVECPIYLSTNIVSVDEIQSIFESSGASYLTMRPFIYDGEFISYDIDDPNEQSESEIKAEFIQLAAASSSSVNTKPSPPIVTPPM